ncbi:MAG: DUF2087 domain-containing protein [Bacillota bacterium]
MPTPRTSLAFFLCGKEFSKDVIYPFGEQLFDAERAAIEHLGRDHVPVFDYLLSMSREYTGLTSLQKDLLLEFRAGRSAREIACRPGLGSPSTVRNHRFRLREREKQAKVFLALMGLVEDQPGDGQELVTLHRGAKMVDERFAITERERKQVLRNYFSQDRLKSIPGREKRKIIVLQRLVERFEAGRVYTEREVNDMLEAAHPDYAALRRYLIDYGFLERTPDGSAYWRKP